MFAFFDLGGGGDTLVAFLLLVAISFAAGALGSLLGLGGGLFLVPALVLLFGVEIHIAIAASLVSVIATSCGAASTNVEEGLTNLRVGMFLEIATALGGLAGAIVAVTILAGRGEVLIIAFVPVVLLSAFAMFLSRRVDSLPDAPPDRLAERFRLAGSYREGGHGSEIPYRVTRTRAGLSLAGVSGVASGLLGVGGGVFNVPGMNAVMNLPLRAASATSTFMIGVTASAGALVYLFAGDVYLAVAAPVSLGTLGGSLLASRYQFLAPVLGLKALFVAILVLAAGLMLVRGVGWLG